MKRSKYGELVTLTKQYIEEEKNWGVIEFEKNALQRTPAPARPAGAARRTLDELHKKIASCKKCPLGKTRLNAVPGSGNPKAQLLFVGEGPGFDEDHKGFPFIGRAGDLLTKIIESINLTRDEVFIANIVKCHPMIDPSDPEKRGNDRPPTPEEMEQCIAYLDQQIDIIQPRFICTLGSSASKTMLKTDVPISKLRGQFFTYKDIPLLPTFHPAALLRNPALKKDVWEDMKKLRDALKKA